MNVLLAHAELLTDRSKGKPLLAQLCHQATLGQVRRSSTFTLLGHVVLPSEKMC